MNLLSLLLAVFWPTQIQAKTTVTVDTAYGAINGFQFEMTNGKTANVFLGIPFAEKPLGDLRFEKPIPPSVWSKPLDAFEFAPACMPHHSDAIGTGDSYSEDCLYLNIVAPTEQNVVLPGYAVMLWIHGGGFCVGTARNYPYESIANNFVSRDIVFVSIQYRLGPFGWLTNGDSALPGNLGYWDQRAALRFVKENIASFGGDPNRITVFGLSAGGASTNALSLSPHTRDLFARGIEMSASSLAPWALSISRVDRSRKLALELGCQIDDGELLKKCLKTKTTEQILDAVDTIQIEGIVRQGAMALSTPELVTFGPIIDGDFFPEDIEQLVPASPKKPTVMGLVSKEGALFTTLAGLPPINRLAISPENFSNFDKETLTQFIERVIPSDEKLGDYAQEARDKLLEHYTRESAIGEEKFTFLERYTELISDMCFNIPVYRMKKLKVDDGWPVWFYFNDHYNKASFNETDPVKGATHLHEYPYLFDISPYVNFDWDDDERKLQDAILTTFTHFAKTGKPSTVDYEWEPVTAANPLRHINFQPNPEQRNGFLQQNFAFWDTMGVRNYDIIRGMKRSTHQQKEEL